MEQTFQTKTYSIRKFNLRQLYADKSKKTNGRVSSIDYFIIVFAPFL